MDLSVLQYWRTGYKLLRFSCCITVQLYRYSAYIDFWVLSFSFLRTEFQNCIDLEESCECQYQNKNIADAAQHNQDTNAFSRDEESVNVPGKYVADSCNKFEEFYDSF